MKLFSSPFKFTIAFTIVYTFLFGNSFAADIKPYKVALVIGDQWQDPASFVIDVHKEQSSNAYAATTKVDDEFALLVIMLKTWCVPFEIIRLDQEFMDINRFFGPDGKPDIGCIIFDADTSADLQPQRYDVLQEAVNDHGISLIALGDRIKEPVIQNLLGIKYVGSWMHSSSLQHSAGHFITNGLANPLDYADDTGTAKKRVQVELTDAKPIITQGTYPQVTVRDLPSGAKAVWIGGDIDQMFSYQAYRTLLRRAITFSVGYSLHKTWQNKAWLIMDDPGSAQNAWLEHWRYPTLTEQQIEQYLIKPLKQHNAVLIMNVLPAFVNDELKRIEPAFQRKFTDEFGTPQDYPSTYRGLINGLKAGVIEIQCHGLTHMQPDLFSPPGPWYGSDLDKERAEIGWYREFGDTRRDKEIPAAEASWRMKTAQQSIQHQFGVTALSFRPGGGGVSTSYTNCTERLAALAGYGWAGGRSGYLGTDFAIRGWAFYGTIECPLAVAAPPDGHDRGIAEYPEQFLRAFNEHPDVEWIGLNEYVAYTHARLARLPDKGLHLQLTYDPHYCLHFKDNTSEWLLSVSDWLAKDLGRPTVNVDGKTVTAKADLSKPLKIKIPPGIGTHNIRIK
ncbi:MAG: hypothetical protein JSV99_06090 [Planctomycetota bacterium]|nr:MAG: hypothetical protein JSV99_06090 [Planctomycetota bacterium]